MKNSIVVFFVVGYFAGALYHGCGKTSDSSGRDMVSNKEVTEQEMKRAGTENLVEWQTFMQESEKTITDNEKRIIAFKEKIEEAGPKAVLIYSKNIGVLEQHNLDLKKKLKEYNNKGEAHWEKFKWDFTQELDGLGKKIENILRENV